MERDEFRPKLSTQQVALLLYLKSRGRVMKSELVKVVSSPPLLNNFINSLKEQDLITITIDRVKHKKFFIELTPKGRLVAEQFRRADDISTTG